MQMTFAAIAAGASVLGLAFANLAPQVAPRASRWRSLSSAGLRPVVAVTPAFALILFLLTLPSAPPFSSGLTLGWGFLTGAVLGLYALFEAAGASKVGAWPAGTVGLLSAACLGPSVILLIFRGYPNEALTGCALGSVFVAAMCSSTARPLCAAAPAEKRETLRCYRGVEVFALATVAVTAAARLGIGHFPRPDPAAAAGAYWASPALMVAAAALLLALLSGGWQRQTSPPVVWRAILACGLAAAGFVVVIAAVLQVKLLPALAWELPLFGLLAFGLVLWGLMQGEQAAEKEEEFRPVALAFGAVLVALAVSTIAFRRLHGYGETLVLLSALPVVAVAYLGRGGSRDPSSPRGESRGEPITESLGVGAFSLVLLLALYRVFSERAGRAPALDFQQHYDFLGVIIGSAACFGLLAFTAQGIDAARPRIEASAKVPWALIGRAILLGAFLAAVPMALGAVWGAKALGAFLAGLVVAQATWMMLAAWAVGEERERVLATAMHIYLVAAALIAVQFSPLVLGLELRRAEKLWIVGIITALAIIWVAASESSRARPEAKKGSGPQ